MSWDGMAAKSPILLLEAEFVEIPSLLEQGTLSWFKFADLVLAFADYVQSKRRVCCHMPPNNQALPNEDNSAFATNEAVSYLRQSFHRVSQKCAEHANDVLTVVELKITRGLHGQAPVDVRLETMTRSMFLYLESNESYQRFRQQDKGLGSNPSTEDLKSDPDPDAWDMLLNIRALSWAMVFLDPYLTGQVYGDYIVAKHASTVSPSVETQLGLSHWFCYEAALFVFDFFSTVSGSEQTNRLNSIIIVDLHDQYATQSSQIDVHIPDRSSSQPAVYFLSTMSSMVYEDCRNRNLSPEESVRRKTHLHFG